jgi:hypothetical protein
MEPITGTLSVIVDRTETVALNSLAIPKEAPAENNDEFM